MIIETFKIGLYQTVGAVWKAANICHVTVHWEKKQQPSRHWWNNNIQNLKYRFHFHIWYICVVVHWQITYINASYFHYRVTTFTYWETKHYLLMVIEILLHSKQNLFDVWVVISTTTHMIYVWKKMLGSTFLTYCCLPRKWIKPWIEKKELLFPIWLLQCILN